MKLKVDFLFNFSYFFGHFNFLNIQKNLINLVSLETQDQVEYYRGKHFGKKKN